MKHELIVQHYLRYFRGRAREELDFYVGQPSLLAAIREAALCRLSNGHRHPHQYRIPLGALVSAERRLQRDIKQLEASASFSELHARVERLIGPIKGIGELATYDIAHRIGAFLKLAPDTVYLHAGTRKGARKLNLKGKSLHPSEFPKEFNVLTPAEIEDCLCIYGDEFGKDFQQLSDEACASRLNKRC